MLKLFALIPFLAAATFAQPASGPSAAQPPTPAELSERVDKLFQRFDSTMSPGCALSVMKGGKIIYKRGYGMADMDHDVPIRPETVFHVASLSKQFTAAAIVMLAQEGRLFLDDDIHKYVPELPDFGTPITLRHLIHHTSGLRDQWSLLSLAGWRIGQDLITDQDVLDILAGQKDLNFKPGEEHLYCNTGYTLLARVVKRVSGKSLREFTSERIFEPLGMKSTHFRDDHAEIVKHIAYGYERGQGEGVFELSVTNFDTVGATSLLTTVEDVALWDNNFYGPRVGGPGLVRQLLEKGKLNNGKQISYAFGLSHGEYRGLATVDHEGADAGYRADFLRFPEQHFSVACLCNLAQASAGMLTRQVADVYLASEFKEPEAKPAPDSPQLKTVALPPQQLALLAGLYWNRQDQRAMKVVLKDGKLFAGAPTDQSLELRPVGENRFRTVGPPITIEFKRTSPTGPLLLYFQNDASDHADILEAAPEFKPSAELLAEFAGTYRSDEIEPVFRVVMEHGSLTLKRLKHNPEKLEPTLEDRFTSTSGSIRFVRDGQGRVKGFVLDRGRIRGFRFNKAL